MNHVIDLLGLEAEEVNTLIAEYAEWIVWGVADNMCRECQTHQFFATINVESESPNDSVAICASGLHIRSSNAFSLEESRVIKSRLQFALDQNGVLGKNLMGFKTAKTILIEVPVLGDDNVPIPSGYKSVGWIKPEEAAAVLETFENKAGVEVLSSSGSGFKTTYHEPRSPEARKYHSCVQLERVKRAAVGRRFWIRKEEADAISESVTIRRDVNFAHLHFGNGGQVQFFDEAHPAAKKYRSITRLLRKN